MGLREKDKSKITAIRRTIMTIIAINRHLPADHVSTISTFPVPIIITPYLSLPSFSILSTMVRGLSTHSRFPAASFILTRHSRISLIPHLGRYHTFSLALIPHSTLSASGSSGTEMVMAYFPMFAHPYIYRMRGRNTVSHLGEMLSRI